MNMNLMRMGVSCNSIDIKTKSIKRYEYDEIWRILHARVL